MKLQLASCCWCFSLKTGVLALCVADIFAGFWGVAKAMRLRTISANLEVTSSVFLLLVALGWLFASCGIWGALKGHEKPLNWLYFWSVFSLLFSFTLSVVDLFSIQHECEYVWAHTSNHNDYQGFQDQFMRECLRFAYLICAGSMLLSLGIRSYFVLVVRSFLAELQEGGGDSDAGSTDKASRSSWYSARKGLRYNPIPAVDTA